MSDERRTRGTPVSHSCRMLHEGNRAPAEKRGQVTKGSTGAVTAEFACESNSDLYTFDYRPGAERPPDVLCSIFYSFQFPDRIRKDEDIHSPVELWPDHISGGGDRHVMPSLSEQWDLLYSTGRKLPLFACRMVTMDRNTPICIYIELDSFAQPSSISTCDILISLEGEL